MSTHTLWNSDDAGHTIHAGGTFPYTFGRIQHGFRVRPDLCATENQFPPDRYIGKFFTDSLVHDRRALQLLVDVIGKVWEVTWSFMCHRLLFFFTASPNFVRLKV